MSVRSEHSTLLFPFELLTTHFCYYVVLNTFFDSFSNIFFVELSHTSGVTVTQQGFCNVYPLSPSERSTLILSFESLLTRSWTAFGLVFGLPHIFSVYFLLILSRKLFCFSCVTITQGFCNISRVFPSVHSTLLFPFESLLTHCHNYVVWTATHFFRLFFFSGTVLLV